MLRWRASALLVNITVTLTLGRVFCVCRCSSFWTGSQNFASAVFAVTLLMSHLPHLFSFWEDFLPFVAPGEQRHLLSPGIIVSPAGIFSVAFSLIAFPTLEIFLL